ncbi:hypothetical protein CEXT_381381 [Caerostris extrusa]|uniref:Uncharacterized protein n=1 Tax=Caerostris extrusa TaxID=172846 RepID=A0AAV4TJE0_CAEEX|nr:hypothetical protein CEXT_381381 [Caerostris extrusa]
MSDAHQIRLNSLNSPDVIITCADECISRGLVLSGTHMLELTDALSLCRTTYSGMGNSSSGRIPRGFEPYSSESKGIVWFSVFSRLSAWRIRTGSGSAFVFFADRILIILLLQWATYNEAGVSLE